MTALPDQATTFRGRKAVTLVATLILTVVAFQLNASMITPALPDIQRALEVSVDDVSQVSSLFFLAGAVGGILLARWSDFVGRRKVLLVILAAIVVGTILCLVATNLPLLLVGRVLQGTSSAAFQLSYVILRETMSDAAFGTTLGILTAINGGVGGVDGWFGGLLTDRFGYKSLFLVILAVAVIAAVCVWLVVPRSTRERIPGKMDWWGAASLSLFLVCITYFVSSGGEQGWSSGRALLWLVGAVVFLVAFIAVEKSRKTPLIDIRHVRSRRVWPVLATTLLLLSSVFTVINFTVVILSQDNEAGFGMSASTSAFMFLMPPALIGLVAAPIAGWLAGKIGWVTVLRTGLVVCIALLAVIAFTPTSKWTLFVMIALLGIGYYGLALTASNGLGVVQSPPEAPAALPSMNSAAFGIGSSLGISIVAPVAASGGIGGYQHALWISVGIAVAAFVVSLILKPAEQAES